MKPAEMESVCGARTDYPPRVFFVKAAHFVFLTDIRGAVEETFDGLSTTHANGLENLMTLIFLEFEDVSLLAV
jgi:hypothetical protein